MAILQEETDVKPTVFNIQANSDTILFGKSGTAIYLEANSLVFEDGTAINSEIKIEVKEYYSTSDIITHNLSTTSNGELLETGGMINIKAFSDNKPLKLKSGKEIIVHFPKDDNNNTKKMNLFSGELNDQNQVTWNEEPSSEGYVKDSILYWYHKHEGLDNSRLYLADGRYIYDWINSELKLTKDEQDYVMFKDINLHYTVTTEGELINVHFKKKVDKKFKKRILSIVKQIPKLKPYSISGNPISMNGWIEFRVTIVPPLYESNTNYLESIENKYPDFEEKNITDLSKVELHYYIFNSAKLGWLNVDRFVNDPSPKVDMNIKLKKPQDVMIKMVYNEFKSVVPPKFEGKTHYFNNIPKGKDITILVIRYDDDKVEMSITEQKTEEGKIDKFNFKVYTMGELKKELEKLN
tara:strand:- start:751 stop:1977 length:1227 start_codon:yes stop_codon:yes gene_type:complete